MGWSLICEYYREFGTKEQFNNLSIASFCDPEKPHAHWPRLKGKGIETKDLVAAVKGVWGECAQSHSDFAVVDRMLQELLEMQVIMSEHSAKLLLPLEVANSYFRKIKRFLRDY